MRCNERYLGGSFDVCVVPISWMNYHTVFSIMLGAQNLVTSILKNVEQLSSTLFTYTVKTHRDKYKHRLKKREHAIMKYIVASRRISTTYEERNLLWKWLISCEHKNIVQFGSKIIPLTPSSTKKPFNPLNCIIGNLNLLGMHERTIFIKRLLYSGYIDWVYFQTKNEICLFFISVLKTKKMSLNVPHTGPQALPNLWEVLTHQKLAVLRTVLYIYFFIY